MNNIAAKICGFIKIEIINIDLIIFIDIAPEELMSEVVNTLLIFLVASKICSSIVDGEGKYAPTMNSILVVFIDSGV